MSGYDGGYSGEGDTNPRAVLRKPVAPTLASSPGWLSGQGSTAPPPPDPAMAAAAYVEQLPVSPASSTRGSPSPETQRERGQREVPVNVGPKHDWQTLPSQQRGEHQTSQGLSTTRPPPQWRQSYRADDDRDSWSRPQAGRVVSWQAAPRAETSSQSPPNPTYQEISAATSQRREDREQETASRLMPSREASWLGSPTDDQAPNPNYNEILAAASQRRNSREHLPPVEEAWLRQDEPRSSQMQHPERREVWMSGTSNASLGAGHPQENVHAAGRSPEPATQTDHFQEYFPIVQPPVVRHQAGQDQYDMLRLAAASRQDQPTTTTAPAEHASLRVEIPPVPGRQWQGSRERRELERARQASWQGVAPENLDDWADQGQQNQTASQGPGQRRDEIAPAPQTRYPYHEQPSQEQRQGSASGPFMHYEDYTFFDPNLSPKDELESRGIRAAETFSTIPENEVRPQARQAWGQHRGSQSKGRSEGHTRDEESRTSSSREFVLPWVPEVLWCLLSVVCAIMVAVVLKLYDGRAVPDWPLGISLNALVAFLVTLCRAAFIAPIMEGLSQLKWNWFVRGERPLSDFAAFDDATRNPVGWAKLLFMARGRALGFCAAVVLLTSLVSSPLSQLLINYPTHYVQGYTSADVASVPRSESYHFSAVGRAPQVDLDIRQKRAVQEAIYHHADTPFPHSSPTCSSGECRWERVSSLAVCVSTADVSDKLSVSDEMKTTELGADRSANRGIVVRNASLPNGVFLIGGPNSYSLNISSAPSWTRDPDSLLQESIAFTNESHLDSSALANFFVVYAEEGTGGVPEPRTFRAMEIILHFCVNTYEVGVSRGIATTALVDTTTEVISNPQDEAHVVPPRDATSSGLGSVILQSRSDGKRYGVTGDHAKALRDYLESVFVGTYSSKHGAKVARSTAASDALGTAMYKGEHVGGTTAASSAEERGAVIGNVMRNVATSLTNSIRAVGTVEAGVVLIPETYVHVRWPWFAFLAGQVFLTSVFLVSIMAQTAVWKVKVLKGSTMATLFAIGAEDKVLLERQKLGIIVDRTELARQAGRITGKFSDGDRGWVLSLGKHGAGV
ncbi:hypothetical protein GQ53DRAFT_836453 [Thozetella sp. PMI_491]|nr:hypothetical protein GQ53DRAFT_836453 [Thozetella sp. PMI_491]